MSLSPTGYNLAPIQRSMMANLLCLSPFPSSNLQELYGGLMFSLFNTQSTFYNVVSSFGSPARHFFCESVGVPHYKASMKGNTYALINLSLLLPHVI